MKYIFVPLFVCIISSSVFGQNISSKGGGLKKVKWDSLESKIPYSDRVELVNSVKSDVKDLFHDSGKEKGFFNRFHIADLNSDGELDLIYSMPEMYTRVWLNIDGKLKLALKDNGVIVEINIDKEKTVLTIVDVPYSPSEMHLLKIFELSTFNANPKFIYESCTSIVNITNVPKSFNLNQPFEVKHEDVELRFDAKVDSATDYFYIGPLGNSIASYKRGSKGHILFEQKGNDGKDWYFVRMDNNIIPVETFHDWNDKNIHPNLPKHIHTLGWIDGSCIIKQ